MSYISRLLTSRRGPVITGIFIGILAPILVHFGNPANMGVCVVCFNRDIAGALGLHRAAVVQYLRPEIFGFVGGSLAASLIFREFRPRTGSAPFVRFLLGVFSVFGALVFLGCPWRAYLRLSGGDWNAIPGILGLIAGIALGVLFLRKGYSLGRNRSTPSAAGWLMPMVMLALLILLIAAPLFGRDAQGNPVGPIFFSASGPGSQHAPILISLAAGLFVGFIAQRSRFCTVGAIRETLLTKDTHLLQGVVALMGAALVTNLILGQFSPGFTGQPVAHTSYLWNFLGMALAGLAFTLAGGCPGRQLILSGEGDGDASVFITGMIVGAGFAHLFSIAASPAGPGPYSAAAVIIGLAVCTVFGMTMREQAV